MGISIDFSKVDWQTSTVLIDGKENERAVAEIGGKNVCIVKQVGSCWASVWVGKEAGVVRENRLESWIRAKL